MQKLKPLDLLHGEFGTLISSYSDSRKSMLNYLIPQKFDLTHNYRNSKNKTDVTKSTSAFISTKSRDITK
ncbi:hypothetical protein, partial [Longitalea arenae]|uniref:hypothetical protein n=1 Tax=Longitalea arenae TaxID=2812558 RepID=UPI0019689E99